MKNSSYNDYDISKKLNVPVGTVGSRASRCYQKLRAYLRIASKNEIYHEDKNKKLLKKI